MDKKKEKNKTEAAAAQETPNPTPKKKTLSGFDMSEYVAKPLASGIVIHREITTIPAKRPNAQQYFRIHPDQEVLVDLLEWKEENDLYLVRQDAIPLLFGLTKRCTLYVGMYLSGNPFLFPVPQPDERGKWNQWHASANRVALAAREKWVRAQPDKSINGYVIYAAEGNIAEPEWPNKTLAEYLSIAFQDKIISDGDHPLVKQLRGLQ